MQQSPVLRVSHLCASWLAFHLDLSFPCRFWDSPIFQVFHQEQHFSRCSWYCPIFLTFPILTSSITMPSEFSLLPLFQTKKSASVHYDALGLFRFSNCPNSPNYSVRRDVLHLITLDVFGYESVVCDHSHSCDVDVFQLNMPQQCFHVFPSLLLSCTPESPHKTDHSRRDDLHGTKPWTNLKKSM